MKKIKLDRPLLVEGKYDKMKLQPLVDGVILTTDGFAVFNSREKTALIRALAAEKGIIVLTDSDGAGKVIRGRIHSLLPPEKVTDLYIPQIPGKEKRKAVPSKEGTLGVEGMDGELLCGLLRPLSADSDPAEKNGRPITKQDFYADGLSGGEASTARRDALAGRFALPRGMSANALLAALNLLTDYDGYTAALSQMEREEPCQK